MKKNIGTFDRILRLVIAIALLASAWWYSSWVQLAIALFVFYEVFASWCAFYALIGKSSCPLNKTDKENR